MPILLQFPDAYAQYSTLVISFFFFFFLQNLEFFLLFEKIINVYVFFFSENFNYPTCVT